MNRVCTNLLDAANAMPCIRKAYICIDTVPPAPPGHEQLVDLIEQWLKTPFINYTQQQQHSSSPCCARCGDVHSYQYCYNTLHNHNHREQTLEIEYEANMLCVLRFGYAYEYDYPLFQEEYDETQEEFNENGNNDYVNWMRVRAYEQQLLYLLQQDARMHAFEFTSSMHVHGRAPVAIRALHKASGKCMQFLMY